MGEATMRTCTSLLVTGFSCIFCTLRGYHRSLDAVLQNAARTAELLENSRIHSASHAAQRGSEHRGLKQCNGSHIEHDNALFWEIEQVLYIIGPWLADTAPFFEAPFITFPFSTHSIYSLFCSHFQMVSFGVPLVPERLSGAVRCF